MIYKDGLVGATGQTAPTNGLEPPLQMISIVVLDMKDRECQIGNFSFCRTKEGFISVVSKTRNSLCCEKILVEHKIKKEAFYMVHNSLIVGCCTHIYSFPH